ncbi:MAG: hypothetical protein MPEBLZ_02552 [Candidatus Methanoperedens nitroreducens]|uniref:Uncharacterized protein n=1 Tax=Candidatus Methanoperedens nitratireducens TaxID=1392998 RepID=A0A0P8DYI9_9EURY|nr:MAG: hypothetical protein MPEBLZ_02552 [Candidatus Methanoperedens sp. BLZ1]CAG0990957.1 hypothetical protein METP2_02570 [Methanosarcinales archaeon]
MDLRDTIDLNLINKDLINKEKIKIKIICNRINLEK